MRSRDPRIRCPFDRKEATDDTRIGFWPVADAATRIFSLNLTRQDTDIRPAHIVVIALLCAGLSACAQHGTPVRGDDPARPVRETIYQARFQAHFVPADGVAEVSIRIEQADGALRLLDLAAPTERYSDFAGDGDVQRQGRRLIWEVPRRGGVLNYRVRIDHARAGGFDAKLTPDYAIFRLDDLFPPARARSLRGATARASLTLTGPTDWSFETRYGPSSATVSFDNTERSFDRPTGWAIAGNLGIRRAVIEERRVAVAAPVGDDFRRMDTLAFLNWTLPSVTAVFPNYPQRTLIVGAGGDFWLGGLSGPGSLFFHSDRPLISENSTSSLLHELVHVATSSPPAAGDDWILEGIAEYYALVLLQRSGGISELRMSRAFEDLAAWSSEDGGRLADPSTGADTAFAATLFLSLARELDAAGSSMDALALRLFDGGPVNRSRLRSIAAQLLGRAPAVLDRAIAELMVSADAESGSR